ncbi:hypothetical protein MKZ38_010136 [Zalerion maritima]|uniref:Uncharacterized protein n=1 Tax=Zalerion maritima TaxID=339359 RepID=A0AAD5RGR1_9PEZI|nr:hypothetical protein MKZ38_010136 [Zalerion maritima]
MAAPQTKTLKDLSGNWSQNKSLSDSPEPCLSLQGISWMLRKAVSMASISLSVKQYTAPASAPADPSFPQNQKVTHVDIEQVAAGLSGTTELRCLDNEFRPHEDWLFGKVKGRSSWIATRDIVKETGDGWLASGEGEDGKGEWLEGDDEKSGPEGEKHMLSHVESVDNGWTATQIWGFMMVDGKRMYARKIVAKKGSQRVAIRLVYDFVGE